MQNALGHFRVENSENTDFAYRGISSKRHFQKEAVCYELTRALCELINSSTVRTPSLENNTSKCPAFTNTTNSNISQLEPWGGGYICGLCADLSNTVCFLKIIPVRNIKYSHSKLHSSYASGAIHQHKSSRFDNSHQHCQLAASSY